jgi:3-dehydroquinate dehydratase/shikimate dehydrogenase
MNANPSSLNGTESNCVVCVPVRERSAERLPAALKTAAERADLVEIRLDYLSPEDLEAGLHIALASEFAPRLILTLRPTKQGGRCELDLAGRLDFWSKVPQRVAYFDWEPDLVEAIARKSPDPDWERIICSWHDFHGVPADLEHIVERLFATPARTIKISIAAQQTTECLALWSLLCGVDPTQRKLIAIAMNEAGALTRVLGPAWGSALTYAASSSDRATAPGQMTIDELLDVYRVKAITEETAILGIIGWPVAHTASPAIHNAVFAHEGMDAAFFHLPVWECPTFLNQMLNPRRRDWPLNWRGVSVTAPHKRTVMAHLDEVDPVAQAIGAVNTVVVRGDKLHGYNTDADGFLAPLRERLIDLRKMKCAVIGSGGAARAAVYALQQNGAKTTVMARDPQRRDDLARAFGAAAAPLADASFGDFDLVVNATPLGTAGKMQERSPVSAEQLKGAQLVYDLVYNPAVTEFMRNGEAAGARTLGGLDMLLNQAAEQFKLWFDQDPPLKVMRDATQAALNRKGP